MRPTEYSEEILRQAREYLDNYEEQGDSIPSIAGLSDTLKKSRETMYAWAKDPEKQEFSYTLAQIEAKQHRVLLSKGLEGEFNAAITKLLLHNHGYSDKQEVDSKQDIIIEVVKFADPDSS